MKKCYPEEQDEERGCLEKKGAVNHPVKGGWERVTRAKALKIAGRTRAASHQKNRNSRVLGNKKSEGGRGAGDALR